MKTFSIGVQISIEADSIQEAYAKLEKILPQDIWLTTDEWFDENGDEIPVSEIHQVRLNHVRG